MSEEENPFLITPKKAHETEMKTESFGTDEDISFMVSPSETPKKPNFGMENKEGPHWESSGTPAWDRKEKLDDEEVVDHS